MDIQATLLTSLRKLAQQHTDETLGDRRHYLGASDIGYCPRKVILERIRPTEHDLPTLLRFQQGHMGEEIIAEAFTAAGYSNFERQVEVDISTDDVPIKVHIDFVFTSVKHKIKSILEVKTTGNIPDGPYSSWESQLYLQMGALAREYPDHTIRGAVLPLNLADGEVGFFNGYTPQETLFNGLLGRAGVIWSDYQATLKGEEVELKTEVTPLCGFCDHLLDCPRFQGDEVPELENMVQELLEWQDDEKLIKGKIDPRKKELLAIAGKTGQFRVGGNVLRKVTRSRKFFVMNRLEAFLADHGASIDEFQEDTTFSFLEIKKAKQVAN